MGIGSIVGISGPPPKGNRSEPVGDAVLDGANPIADGVDRIAHGVGRIAGRLAQLVRIDSDLESK
jgi:hypothetical protein